VQIDFYGVRTNGLAKPEPDLERELVRTDAVARGKCGDVVLMKIWLRTTGVADLERVEAAIAAAIAPLGVT
jgi:hypothetical protein